MLRRGVARRAHLVVALWHAHSRVRQHPGDERRAIFVRPARRLEELIVVYHLYVALELLQPGAGRAYGLKKQGYKKTRVQIESTRILLFPVSNIESRRGFKPGSSLHRPQGRHRPDPPIPHSCLHIRRRKLSNDQMCAAPAPPENVHERASAKPTRENGPPASSECHAQSEQPKGLPSL